MKNIEWNSRVSAHSDENYFTFTFHAVCHLNSQCSFSSSACVASYAHGSCVQERWHLEGPPAGSAAEDWGAATERCLDRWAGAGAGHQRWPDKATADRAGQPPQLRAAGNQLSGGDRNRCVDRVRLAMSAVGTECRRVITVVDGHNKFCWLSDWSGLVSECLKKLQFRVILLALARPQPCLFSN